MDLREEIFSKNFRLAGDNAYNKEDVDAFFDKFFDAFEQLTRQNEELKEKLIILADKVEEYRKNEVELGIAKIDVVNIIDKTKQNAEEIINLAKATGEEIIQNAKKEASQIVSKAKLESNKIIQRSEYECLTQQAKMKRIQREVKEFKDRLFAIYKSHIESINDIESFIPDPKQYENLIFDQDGQIEPGSDKAQDFSDNDQMEFFELQKTYETEESESEDSYDKESAVDSPKPKSDEQDIFDTGEYKDMKTSSRYKNLKFGEDYDIFKDDDY